MFLLRLDVLLQQNTVKKAQENSDFLGVFVTYSILALFCSDCGHRAERHRRHVPEISSMSNGIRQKAQMKTRLEVGLVYASRNGELSDDQIGADYAARVFVIFQPAVTQSLLKHISSVEAAVRACKRTHMRICFERF